MPGNTFGLMFRVTTWGESHGKALGAVVDGCPAGMPLSEEDLKPELALRRPGRRFTTPRKEGDEPEILSGIFKGRTTGMPISIMIRNKDVISEYYESIKFTPRPGHADLAYIKKYGFENWDYRGGGRASGRETVSRVAAGAIAKKLLSCLGIIITGAVVKLGKLDFPSPRDPQEGLRTRLSPFRVVEGDERVEEYLKEVLASRDSVGGVVEVTAWNAPPGLGEPVFDKLKADLAKAMTSIPAAVGFEVGAGFELAEMRGSEARDKIVTSAGEPVSEWEKSGGMLGGISVGSPIKVRVAFKPTSSIMIPEKTVDLRTLEETDVRVPGRHDPAIVLRAVAVAEAMMAIVLADHALRSGLINPVKIEWDPSCEKTWSLYREYITS